MIDDLKLNISQIPYIFGIKLYDIEKENIKLLNNENEQINYQTFTELLQTFIDFFTAEKKYFPLANLYFMFDMNESLNDVLIQGFKHSISTSNLRELKYFCKLLSLCAQKDTTLFSRSTLKKFYDWIIYFLNKLNDESLLQQYRLHDGQIRSYLLDNNLNEISFQFKLLSEDILESQLITNSILKEVEVFANSLGIGIEFGKINVSTYSKAIIESNIKHIFELNFGILKYKKEILKVESIDKDSIENKNNDEWTSHQKITIGLTLIQILIGGSIALNSFGMLPKNVENKIVTNQEKAIKLHNEKIKPFILADTLVLKNELLSIYYSENILTS